MNSLIKGTKFISDLAILAPTHLSYLLIDFAQGLCELNKGGGKKYFCSLYSEVVFTSLASTCK